MALMSIGKFAKEIGLSTQHLRKLHEDGVIIPDIMTKGGTRYYSDIQLNQYLNKCIDDNKRKLPLFCMQEFLLKVKMMIYKDRLKT